MQHTFSPERPLIMENFIQQLMEGAEETEGRVTFSRGHLQASLTALACSMIGREKNCFQAYSLFYENILQQESQLLYCREQDIKALEESQRQSCRTENQVAELCRRIMMEITALRTRLVHMEEDYSGLQQQMNFKHQRCYDSLVRDLFSTCIQLKARLDEYHVQMEQDVTQLVSRVRKEAVDSIARLGKRFGSTEDEDSLTETLSKHLDLQNLRDENSQLEGLICKLRALDQWKKSSSEVKLSSQLHRCRQEAFLLLKEKATVKLMSEVETEMLQQELEVARKALIQCQAECSSARRHLKKQTQQLREADHRQAQEERGRQQQNALRSLSLQRLQEEVSSREQQLRSLSMQKEQSNRDSQLQRLRSHQEIKRVRGQLLQERSLKLDAFQQVDELQSQVYITEAALSGSRTQQGSPWCSWPAAHSSCYLVREGHQDDPSSDQETHPSTIQNGSKTRIQRPKTRSSCFRSQVSEAFLPELGDSVPLVSHPSSTT